MDIWSSLDTELYTDIFNIQIRIFLISVPTAFRLPSLGPRSLFRPLSFCPSVAVCQACRRPVYTLSSRDLWQ